MLVGKNLGSSPQEPFRSRELLSSFLKSALHFESCLWFILSDTTSQIWGCSSVWTHHSILVKLGISLTRSELRSAAPFACCFPCSQVLSHPKVATKYEMQKRGRGTDLLSLPLGRKHEGLRVLPLILKVYKGSHAAGRVWSGHGVAQLSGPQVLIPPSLPVSPAVSSKAQELFSLVESGIWHPMTGQEAIDPKCRKFH